jgi:V/A-type H+/Na+-transporting ATPase subunit D
MQKIKLTKGELKKQRDALRQYERYLPTLQLKKQQLQLEIIHQQARMAEKARELAQKRKSACAWAGLLQERAPGAMREYLVPVALRTERKNIAGVEIEVFVDAHYAAPEYDLFATPLWMDAAIDALRVLFALGEEIRVIETGIGILRQELRVTNQRVNLFEKVKIPEAREAIRQIRIFIGDQLTGAVGRGKIAKGKIEQATLQEAYA